MAQRVESAIKAPGNLKCIEGILHKKLALTLTFDPEFPSNWTQKYPIGDNFDMLRPLESNTIQDPSSTPEPAASDLTDENSGDAVLKALRSLSLSKPSSPATALNNNFHHQLPARSLSQSTVHKDSLNLQLSSSSSSVKTASKQTSYDNDQQTPSESAEEEEEDVEFVMEPTPVPSDIDTVSVSGSEQVGDSSKHIGNGVTCRYYNKNRCGKGNSCAYSHAPDLYSLRSHPEGRNVCLYFIHNNMCRFKGNQCNYSHSREDLQWDDEELAKQLAAKLTLRKNELTAKKEEKKASRTRHYSPSIDPIKKPLPNKPLRIAGPLMEVTIPAVPPPKDKWNRKPSKNGSYAAGANVSLPRWDSPQTLDRLQLMRFGLLAWDGSLPQQQYVPAPYIIYPPMPGYPPGYPM